MKKWFLFCCLILATTLISADSSWNAYKKQVLHYQKHIPGWCVPEKAEKMMELIYEIHPSVCVEVGVFGGSSVYPTAAALAFQQGGVIHAIDPWSNTACTEGYDTNDPNAIWWSKVNLEEIYQNFITMIRHKHLEAFCHTMRTTSIEAATHFQNESIDILHIDGNHSEKSALIDASLWLPKVKKGGYIWFDDVNWKSTNKAVQYIMEHCTLDLNRSIGNECYLFKKN